jgi:hypothetical protein
MYLDRGHVVGVQREARTVERHIEQEATGGVLSKRGRDEDGDIVAVLGYVYVAPVEPEAPRTSLVDDDVGVDQARRVGQSAKISAAESR